MLVTGSSVRRTHTLYWLMIAARVRAIFAHKVELAVLAVATVLSQGAGLILIFSVFRLGPRIGGWSVWDVVLSYAVMIFAEGCVVSLAQGLWRLPRLVATGEFDVYMVRPLPLMVQVLGSEVGMNGIGNILLGGVLIGMSVPHIGVRWDVPMAIAALFLLAGGVAVKFAITSVSCATAFWLRSPYSGVAYTVERFGDLARFPINIYGVVFRVVLVTVVPFAFVTFLPIAALVGSNGWSWVGWSTPVVGVIAVVLAVWIFRRGVARYESTGT